MDNDGLHSDTKSDSPIYSLRERRTDTDMELTPHATSSAAPTQYRTYKRRWFGLVQLVLMNIVVSWCVSSPSELLYIKKKKKKKQTRKQITKGRKILTESVALLRSRRR